MSDEQELIAMVRDLLEIAKRQGSRIADLELENALLHSRLRKAKRGPKGWGEGRLTIAAEMKAMLRAEGKRASNLDAVRAISRLFGWHSASAPRRQRQQDEQELRNAAKRLSEYLKEHS